MAKTLQRKCDKENSYCRLTCIVVDTSDVWTWLCHLFTKHRFLSASGVGIIVWWQFLLIYVMFSWKICTSTKLGFWKKVGNVKHFFNQLGGIHVKVGLCVTFVPWQAVIVILTKIVNFIRNFVSCWHAWLAAHKPPEVELPPIQSYISTT